jgi:hypothetical protein
MAADEDILDLRRIEDVFACLEVISMAQGTLFGVDPTLAASLGRVTEALGAFSELVAEGGLEPQQPAQPAGMTPPVQQPAVPQQQQSPPVSPLAPLPQDKYGFVDLVGGGGALKNNDSVKGLDPGGDGIVDLLAGKK